MIYTRYIYNEQSIAYFIAKTDDYIPFYNLLSHIRRLYIARLYQSSMDQSTTIANCQDTSIRQQTLDCQDKYGYCNGNITRLQSKYYNTAIGIFSCSLNVLFMFII